MSNELTKTTTTEVAVVNDKVIDDYLFGSDTKLTETQKGLFKGMATSLNLNPFKREIYAIPYIRNVKNDRGVWEKVQDMSIVTGYQVYIDKAAASGNLDGWNVKLTEAGAIITIYRKDFKHAFEWEVEKDEFMKKDRDGNAMGTWKTMPNFMIKKVAIGQGFRLAFPNELGGMPYLQEEIVAGEIEEVEPPKKEAPKKAAPTTVTPAKTPKEAPKEEPVIEAEVVEEKPQPKKEAKPVAAAPMATPKKLSEKQIKFITDLWEQL